ncbi:MAG: hypothetical protein QY316_05125 [Thermodesulfobacteriota bacterium]|nr:MAG: hypothetical protein QY316_05125 [Thermodesulfobacteriota bacterium]
MLKKSFLDFFNHGLAGMNPSKPHKLLDLDSLRNLAIHPWIAWQGVFNTLLKIARKSPIVQHFKPRPPFKALLEIRSGTLNQFSFFCILRPAGVYKKTPL